MPDAPRMVLSVPEAAEELGVDKSTVYRLAANGTLPHVRIGRRIVIPREALARWLAESAA